MVRVTGLRLFLAAALLSAAAGLTIPAGGQKAAPARVWRHGIIEAKSDAGILFMASRRDFAARLGLKLDFIQLKTDQIALKALLAGELDSYEGGTGGAMVAALRGADVKVVGCNWLVVPHGVYVRRNIASISDLKGHAVAVSTPGSFPDMFAHAAFEKAGIAMGELKLAAMGADTDRYKALVAGVVDGAIVTNEFDPIAGKEGIRNVMPASEAMPNYLRICLHMAGKTLAEHRDDAVKFLAAEIEGLRYAMSHRDETIRVTREITGMKPDDPRPAFVFDEAVRTNAIGTELPLPMDKLDYMQQLLVRTGTLPRPVDLAKLVDKDARERALALPGL